MDYITIPKLKDGFLYRIRARNAAFGIWKSRTNAFLISRVKFDTNFLFEEYHYDTGAPFGTVIPLYELQRSPFNSEDLKMTGNAKSYEILSYLNSFELPHEEQRLLDLNVPPEQMKRILSKYYKKYKGNRRTCEQKS